MSIAIKVLGQSEHGVAQSEVISIVMDVGIADDDTRCRNMGSSKKDSPLLMYKRRKRDSTPVRYACMAPPICYCLLQSLCTLPVGFTVLRVHESDRHVSIP